jgi:DNA topoisomerase-1
MKYVKVGKVFDPKQKYRTIMISDKEAMGTPVTIPGGKEHTGMAIKVYKNGDIVVDEISSGRPGWGTKMVDNLIENSPSDAKIYVHNDWSAGWWDKMAAKYPKNIIFDYDEGFGTAIRKGVKPSKIVVPKVIKPKVSVTGLLDEVDKGKYPQYKLTNQEDALIDRVSNDVSAANRKYKHVRKNIKTDDLVFVEKEGRVPGVKRSLNLSPEDLQKELDSKHIVVVDLGDGKYYTTAFDDSELMAAYKRSDIDEIRVTVVDPSDLPKPKVPMVNRSSEVFTDAKKLHADMEVFVKTVDPAERSIIETYIKDSSSSSWNADLRSDMPASKWLKSNRSEYDNFLKSYSKLPKYDGVSYRGISFDDSVVHKNFIDGLEEGGIFVEKGLMSTSSSRYTALNFVDESEWSKGVLFKVRGKTGRPISEFVKEGYDESEILFAPNSKFKIVKKSKVDGRWQIELEELDSTVVAKKKAVEKVAAPDKVMGEQFKAPKAPAIDPNTNYTRSGDIFMYQGQVVQGDVAKRLKAMKLPPAWKDVVISTDPSAKIQAIGTARNGKTQYRYSAEHVATKAREKFERSRLFSGKLGTIRGKVEVDILKKNPKAMLLKLEDETGIRIGTNADLNAKTKAYGLTTLEHRHAKVVGNKVTLDFVAKEGINAHYEVTDRHLAEFIKDRIEISKPGEKLFPDVTAKHLNKYLRELSGDKAYSIKDYRTFHGTRIAFEELEQYAGKTLTDVEKTKIIEEVTLTVSKFLHNTPAMARKSYIDPMVWDVIGGL